MAAGAALGPALTDREALAKPLLADAVSQKFPQVASVLGYERDVNGKVSAARVRPTVFEVSITPPRYEPREFASLARLAIGFSDSPCQREHGPLDQISSSLRTCAPADLS